MAPRLVRRSSVVLLFLAVASVTSAQAQERERDFSVRFQSGVTMPVGDFDRFFRFGPSFGVDVVYPLRDRLDALLDLDLDIVNKHAVYPTPRSRLWRYRLGLEGDLLGERSGSLALKAYGGAGLTTFRSERFFVEARPDEPADFDRTYLTGTGGLRLGFGAGAGLRGWLSGEYNWTLADEDDTRILSEAARNEVPAFGSASSVGVTLGFSLPVPR